MNATAAKTFLAAFALGTSLVAAPALAGDRHHARCVGGAIVDAETFGFGNDLKVDASGCSETSVQQTRGGNTTSITARDDARLAIQDMGGADTEFYARDRGQIGARTIAGRTAASVRDDARAAITTIRGTTNFEGAGYTDTHVENVGGSANLRHFGSGRMDVRIGR